MFADYSTEGVHGEAIKLDFCTCRIYFKFHDNTLSSV